MKHTFGFTAVLVGAMMMLCCSAALAQVSFVTSLVVSDGPNSRTLYFGAHSAAHYCIDSSDNFFGHRESDLPPFPVTGVFEARFINPNDLGGLCFDQGSYVDFRPLLSVTQRDTFRVRFQRSSEAGDTAVQVTWPSGLNAYAKVLVLVDVITGGTLFSVNMLTQTSANIPFPHTDFWIFFEPAEPQFAVNPTSIAFGDVVVGDCKTDSVVVTNGGVVPLIISAITPPHASFTVTPGAPQTVAPSGSKKFYITFCPTTAGLQSGNIIFTHNAPGGTGTVSVSGTGTLPCPLWTKSYNNSPINKKEDMGFKIYGVAKTMTRNLAVDGAGNVYVAGFSEGPTTTKVDYVVVKYNPYGDTQWVARWNNIPVNKNDKAYGLAIDASGNVYVTGESDNGTGTKIDIATVKFNSSGQLEWQALWNNAGVNKKDIGYGIAVDPTGQYVYVCGESDNGATTKIDAITLAYDASTGALLWSHLYDGAMKKDYWYAIRTDAAGDVVVTGQSDGGSATKNDATTVKYAGGATLSQLWVHRYNNSLVNKNEAAFDLKIDAAGNIYVGGVADNGTTKDDFLMLKYAPAGGTPVVGTYNNAPVNKKDIGYAIDIDASGNAYVAGASEGSGTKYDYLVVKFNAAGDTVWSRRYDGGISKDDVARSVSVCESGGYVFVTGSSDQGAGRKLDYLTLRLDMSTGSLGWAGRFNGAGLKDDIAYNVIAQPGSCCVVIAGKSDGGAATKLDFVTIQGSWSAPVPGPITTPPIPDGEEELDGEERQPSVFTLYHNYPNPFNPTTTIGFSLPQDAFVTLKVYNTLGQEVATLIDRELFDEGQQEVVFNAAGLASGVYFYRVTCETIPDDGTPGQSFVSVKKMVVLK